MIRAFALLLALPTMAVAADRTWLVTSFDHLRVSGPFRVHVVQGSPSAHASGSGDTLDGIDVHQNGGTLVVSASGAGWGERPHARAEAPVIEVATPALANATVIGGAQVRLDGMRGQAVSVQLAGNGEIAATAIAADQLSATLTGNGHLTLGGKALKAALATTGSGTIDAADLATQALAVHLDGPGHISAAARATADIVSTGFGTVTVAGNAVCKVTAPADGAVDCGAAGDRAAAD